MLTDLSAEHVLQIVEDSMGASPLPYLSDPAVRQRAGKIAKDQGLLERIERELTPGEPIGVLPYTRFRDYRRDGNRTRYQAFLGRRSEQIDLAAMACYLGLDCVDYLQDLLWAECEATTWIMPAHEGPARPVDLRVAGCGEAYAIVVTLLADRLAEEVRLRVIDEVRRRLLETFLDPRWRHSWKTTTNNWNAVCHACTCIAGMLVETDPKRLGRIIAESLENLQAFVSGFTADGGCSEGPGYWRYGFGHFAHLGAALHDFTGGRIDIMAGEHVARIGRYPLAVLVAPGQELEFADAHSAFLSLATAVEINRFHDVPELFGLCAMRDNGSLEVRSLRELLLYDGRTHAPRRDTSDACLPDLGVVRARSAPVTLGVKAGCNAEHHNHNDVGSFVLHRGGTFFLCDPGAPVYSRSTFSERRYESVFCNSFGHSVPVINGCGQPAGAEYAGTIEAAGLDEPEAKAVRIEMARAYDVPSLKRLTRTLELPPGGQEAALTDEFVFPDPPEHLAEAFMTYQPAEAFDGGAAVRIRSDADGTLEIRPDGADGTFDVADLADESARESRSGRVLRRITFTPAVLAAEMRLRFRMRWVE